MAGLFSCAEFGFVFAGQETYPWFCGHAYIVVMEAPQNIKNIQDGADWSRWPNFTSFEMSCRHCGEIYHWPEFMDKLQQARDLVGSAFYIHSAHRCSLHNARIGGAPLSQHLKLAADIGLHGHDRRRLYMACKKAGFTGFGFYQTFLHIDLGPRRSWYDNTKAQRLWQIY